MYCRCTLCIVSLPYSSVNTYAQALFQKNISEMFVPPLDTNVNPEYNFLTEHVSELTGVLYHKSAKEVNAKIHYRELHVNFT